MKPRRPAAGALPRFALVTGNPGKLAEARRMVGRAVEGGAIEAVAMDLPEIQSLDYREVLRAKGEEAWRRLGRPLVVEEAGLDLAALGGFPGPLVKWMLEAAGAAGIARTAAALGDSRATARCFLLYQDGERSVVAEGATEGTLVAPRGSGGFGWDPVFQPEGSERTFAELAGQEKDAVSHRGRAWRALLAALGG
jgi:XTP/dITP diphosphohydrolase